MADEVRNYNLLLDFQANAQKIAHLTACLTLSNSELAQLRQQKVSASTKHLAPNADLTPFPKSPTMSRSSCIDAKSPAALTLRPIGKSSRSPPPSASQQSATRSWTADEHARFLAAHAVHGRGWSAISAVIGSRTPKQVRTYAQRLERRSGTRLMGRPKVAFSSPSKIEALTPASTRASKVAPTPAPTSPVTPKVRFPFGGAALADESYQERSSAGALNDILPDIAHESDSMSFMSLLPPPVEDATSLLYRPESANLELPFGTFPGLPGVDEEMAWDDIHDVEPLSLHAFAPQPSDDRAL